MAFFKKTRAKFKEGLGAAAKTHAERFSVPGRMIASRTKYILEQSRQPPPASFQALLDSWGLAEDDIPTLQKHLKRRFLIFSVVFVLVGGLLLAQGLFFSAFIVGVPTLAGLLTSLWRMSIFKNRRFVTFKSWFFSSRAKAGPAENISESDEAPIAGGQPDRDENWRPDQ